MKDDRSCATCLHCKVVADSPDKCRCERGEFLVGFVYRRVAEWIGHNCDYWQGEDDES